MSEHNHQDFLNEKELEKMFLAAPGDAVAIYQLVNHEDTLPYRFASMDQLEAAGLIVRRTNYEAVYTEALPDTQGKTIADILEDTYYRFNMERPADFSGHSLSVSDVVAVKLDGAVSVHFVDRIGFHELNDFLEEQPLRNAEMQIEDDYGMIDGIINNGKREPDRERPSVMQQLRQPPETPSRHSSKGKNEPLLE